MENASKALLIAGGILLAILVTSLLMMMLGNLGSIRTEEEERLALEQAARFNARFEAYDRQLLTGQDVISLVNMAMNNNRNPDFDVDNNPMFINITLDLSASSGFVSRERVVEYDFSGGRRSSILISLEDLPRQTLTPGEHSLMRRGGGIDQDFENFFGTLRVTNPPPVVVEMSPTTNRTTYTESGLSAFRLSTFEAVSFERNRDGRINDITIRYRRGSER